MVEVERRRGDRFIHFECERTTLIIRSRRKRKNGNQAYSRITKLAKEELGESTPGKYRRKSSQTVGQQIIKDLRVFEAQLVACGILQDNLLLYDDSLPSIPIKRFILIFFFRTLLVIANTIHNI